MEIKKILYLSQMDASDICIKNDGVTKKIFWQINSFKTLGYEVDYVCKKNNTYYYISNSNEEQKLFEGGKYSFIDSSKLCIKLIELINKNRLNLYEYVYIRAMKVDLNFLKLMKIFKINGCKVIIEYPTYPPVGELGTSLKRKIGYIIDTYYSRKLSKYVYGTVNFHGYNEIHNIKSLCIENGINIESIPKKNKCSEKKSVDLIAVAKMSKWHGYERLIKGLRDYYSMSNEYEVKLHLVGNGPEINYYKDLVNKYKLDPYILFYGDRGGEELNNIFNKCDIAIGSLGLYKIGVDNECTLKGKEYCARGIPYIISQNKVSDKFKYRYVVPNNSTNICIENIISYYNLIKDDKDVVYIMREYAQKNYSWDKQMQNIIDYFK